MATARALMVVAGYERGRGDVEHWREGSTRIVAAACPFNRLDYASALGSTGEPELASDGSFFLLRRPVPGTDAFDGIGPWPYFWISTRAQLDALRDGFRHLLTVTAVTQPGLEAKALAGDAVVFKHHHVFDPSRPVPALSARARKRLSACERIAAFEVVSDQRERAAIGDLYETLKVRRRILGDFRRFDAGHFATIARLPESVFFRVRKGEEIGAMACGVVFGDMLQMLHMPNAPAGLRWNASYLMMHGLQGFAREKGLRLLTGGQPYGASDGLEVFKRRWSNGLVPVHMLRIVNDPRRYAEFCAAMPGEPGEPGYFPAYRSRA